MDVYLRDGHGFDLTRAFRRMSVHAKVVILSSHSLPEYRQAALRSGADHFLEKYTLGVEDIAALVQSAVRAKTDA